jgi:Zn-dependent protease with chaperone function
MSVPGIMSSQFQRRLLFFFTLAIIAASCLLLYLIYAATADSRGWNLIIGLLSGVIGSAIFALLSAFFIYYFFTDPFAADAASQLLPEDIAASLKVMANTATEYKLYVRTGRHFRSVILPLLVQRSQQRRMPISIEVVLLDCRDTELCEKYAGYRRASSFDRNTWDLPYVQIEIIATILALLEAASDNIRIDLYLSKRLSTFRLDGTSDEVIVTRENPRDDASRYRRSHQRFAAYQQEFLWVKQDASKVDLKGDASLRAAFENTFTHAAKTHQLLDRALAAMSERSPYES